MLLDVTVESSLTPRWKESGDKTQCTAHRTALSPRGELLQEKEIYNRGDAGRVKSEKSASNLSPHWWGGGFFHPGVNQFSYTCTAKSTTTFNKRMLPPHCQVHLLTCLMQLSHEPGRYSKTFNKRPAGCGN